MDRPKVRLTEEKETLLVPLLGKAMESKRPHPIIVDPKAEEILESVEYDFKQLNAPRKTLVMLAMRAKQLDSYVRDYLKRADDPLVLHLGCGLDSRVLRVGFETLGKGSWYDLDFPDVIDLRLQFYQETDRYHMIASSVTAPDWMGQVPVPGGPAMIVAEGLFMYLHEEDIKRLFLDLQRRFPGSEIAFDAFSALTAKGANSHPSIKKTGAHIYWGIDDPRGIEHWGSGIEVLEEWYFSDSEDIPSLGLGDRIMYGITAAFRMAKTAHRILRVRLGVDREVV